MGVGDENSERVLQKYEDGGAVYGFSEARRFLMTPMPQRNNNAQLWYRGGELMADHWPLASARRTTFASHL